MIRILVVDDLEALLDVVKYVLESNPGFIVDTATSVEQALASLKGQEYDIIISDYYMPGETGIDFLKILRAEHNTIPFVIQTGQGDEVTAIEALQNGADFFLEKGNEGPLQYLAFTQIINLLVTERKTQEKLVKSESKFKSLFEMHSDGMLYVDADGNIQDVNLAFLTITGCTEEQIKKMSYLDLIPGEWTDFDCKAIKEQAFTRGESEEFLREYVRCDGYRSEISIRAHLVKNELDEPEGIWIIVRNLS